MLPPHTKLDDPESVHSFLAFLRTAAGPPQASSQYQPALTSASSSTSNPQEHVSNQGASNGYSGPSGSTTPHEVSSFGSPDVTSGTRAPPSTPAFRATLTYNGNHLETLPEVDDFASEEESPEDTVPHLGANLDAAAEVEPAESTQEPKETEDHTAARAVVEWASKSSENLSHSKYATRSRVPVIVKTASSERPSSAVSTLAPSSKQATSERAPNKELADKMKALSANNEYQDTVLAKFREEHSPEEVDTKMMKVQGGGSDAEEGGDSTTAAPEPPTSARSDATVPFPAFEDSPETTTGQAGAENREQQVYFSSWGSATPRDAHKSRIRTVVLTNLPAATDATLVTSLIHGGAIETLKVTRSTETAPTLARVTFTTGDAADAYYSKYPNGIDFRFQGKKYTAFVEKGMDVDVVSGVMRGYLESGASRVVRATGADEDWGMRALKKLAEEKNRKVESINDNSREETRTITFRFTNISDAVQFKSTLIRDIDWETCDIHFGVDPCEKATGAHFEDRS